MAFENTILTSEGLKILAQLTATKTLTIKRIFVSVEERTASDFELPPAAWLGMQDTRVNSTIASIGAEGQQTRIVVGMTIKPQFSEMTVTVKSIAITGCTVENGTEGEEVVIFGLADAHGVDVIANASVSLTTNVSFIVKINAASSVTIEGGTNPNYVLQSDLDRFVSCHKAGDQHNGEYQIIRGTKNFQGPVEFNNTVWHSEPLTVETADGAALYIADEGERQLFIGKNIDGNACITAINGGDEELTFGWTDDAGTGNEPAKTFMRMYMSSEDYAVTSFDSKVNFNDTVYCDNTLYITELDIADSGDPEIYCSRGLSLIPYAEQGRSPTNTLGNEDYKWASVWTNNLFTTTFKLNDTGSQYVNFDGEMFTFKLNPAANSDPMMSISYVDGLYCSKPITNQYINFGANITQEVSLQAGNKIYFFMNNAGNENALSLYLSRDYNADSRLTIYDAMEDEEIGHFTYNEVIFDHPKVQVSNLKVTEKFVPPVPSGTQDTPCGVPFFVQFTTTTAAAAVERGSTIKPTLSGGLPRGTWDIYDASGTLLKTSVVLQFCTISGYSVEGFSSDSGDLTADTVLVALSPSRASTIEPFMVVRVQ